MFHGLNQSLTPSAASSDAAFFLSRAFTFAVVERTAVVSFAVVSFFGVFIDDGYANKLGLAFEMKSNLGALRSSVKPIIPVGWNARLAQWARGYQYQNWQNITIPTIALVFPVPALLCKLMVTLRPPASIKLWPRAAPKRAIGSSCLSPTSLA